jgi:hypothetical protein
MILPSVFEHVAAYTVAALLLGLAYVGRLSPIRLVLLLTVRPASAGDRYAVRAEFTRNWQFRLVKDFESSASFGAPLAVEVT